MYLIKTDLLRCYSPCLFGPSPGKRSNSIKSLIHCSWWFNLWIGKQSKEKRRKLFGVPNLVFKNKSVKCWGNWGNWDRLQGNWHFKLTLVIPKVPNKKNFKDPIVSQYLLHFHLLHLLVIKVLSRDICLDKQHYLATFAFI